jgi:hypothetical protein
MHRLGLSGALAGRDPEVEHGGPVREILVAASAETDPVVDGQSEGRGAGTGDDVSGVQIRLGAAVLAAPVVSVEDGVEPIIEVVNHRGLSAR